MRYTLILIFNLSMLLIGYSQTVVNINSKNYFIKKTEEIGSNFKIFNICQDKGLKKNCTDYYVDNKGIYLKLPILKNQLVTLLNSNNFSSVKSLNKIIIDNSTLYFIKNANGNTYLTKDESGNLVLFPTTPSNDVITMSREAGSSSLTERQKCNKKCSKPLPPGCHSRDANGNLTDCFLRHWETYHRCFLSCIGKIRMSQLAPFEGIVINTKSN